MRAHVVCRAMPCRSVFVSGICFLFLLNFAVFVVILYKNSFYNVFFAQQTCIKKQQTELERERKTKRSKQTNKHTHKHTLRMPYISKKRILFITCIIRSAFIFLTAFESHIYGCSSSEYIFVRTILAAWIAKQFFLI